MLGIVSAIGAIVTWLKSGTDTELNSNFMTNQIYSFCLDSSSVLNEEREFSRPNDSRVDLRSVDVDDGERSVDGELAQHRQTHRQPRQINSRLYETYTSRVL